MSVAESRHVLVMAGGTGGHVFPGLAVAQVLRERGWSVHWLGNPLGMEATLVPKHGFVLEPVEFGGLRGKGLFTKIMLPIRLARACWQAAGVMRRVQPHVVLGLGGYITFPGGVMARVMGRPLVLHEQNSVAGMANRILSRLAVRVLSAFPKVLPSAQWVGNPVRTEIAQLIDPAVRYGAREGRLHLLVVGGSLGAQALNQILPQAFALMPAQTRPVVVHQCGKGHALSVRQAYLEAGCQDAVASDFIDDMAAAYANADVVVCRAGAMTVSELAAAGVAALMVPYPHAVDDHQTYNAKFLSDVGAGWLLPQTELTAQSLADRLTQLNREQCMQAAVKARGLAKPQATQDVATICEALALQAGKR
jgi:UDP-N-acetylglucosamine--N-acetylmuramyl-(pentapeptide) pyrophosphoryl-undecaprenol N-acetylglucosamine transferase